MSYYGTNFPCGGCSKGEKSGCKSKKKKCQDPCVSLSLAVTATPNTFSIVGEVIIFTYTITNLSCITVCGQATVYDSLLGPIQLNVSLPPGQSQTFTRTYTINASSITSPILTSIASVSVYSCDCPCPSPSSSVTTYLINKGLIAGSADLYGSLTQTPTNGMVMGNITISNSATSATPAYNVNLTIPPPAYVSNIVPGAGVTYTGTALVINIPSLGVGVNSNYFFNYTPTGPTGTSYTWSGTIVSSTPDPNFSNNFLTSTIVV